MFNNNPQVERKAQKQQGCLAAFVNKHLAELPIGTSPGATQQVIYTTQAGISASGLLNRHEEEGQSL